MDCGEGKKHEAVAAVAAVAEAVAVLNFFCLLQLLLPLAVTNSLIYQK